MFLINVYFLGVGVLSMTLLLKTALNRGPEQDPVIKNCS